MKLFKKFGHKVARASKFGHRLAKQVGFGVKRAAQAVQKYAPKVQQIAGTVAAGAAAYGLPQVAAVAGLVAGGAALANKIAPGAKRIGSNIEKAGKKQYRDAFEDIRSGGKFK